MYRGFISHRYIDGSLPESTPFVNLVGRPTFVTGATRRSGSVRPRRYPRCP